MKWGPLGGRQADVVALRTSVVVSAGFLALAVAAALGAIQLGGGGAGGSGGASAGQGQLALGAPAPVGSRQHDFFDGPAPAAAPLGTLSLPSIQAPAAGGGPAALGQGQTLAVGVPSLPLLSGARVNHARVGGGGSVAAPVSRAPASVRPTAPVSHPPTSGTGTTATPVAAAPVTAAPVVTTGGTVASVPP